jgi:riboflavin biosynthesis pyrimidine reductase
MRRLWPDPGDIDDVAGLVARDARPTPARRPWLLVNMITSLDGAVSIDNRSGGLARPADKAMFSALRAVGDVVLAGAGTVRAEHYGPARPSADLRAARRDRGQAEVPRVAIVTRSLDLDLTRPLFTEGEVRPYVLTCESSPPERRTAAAAVADVIVAGDVTVDLPAAMAALHDREVRTITCEGGPHLNGDLVLADLVDEWALTLTPLLVGGDARRSTSGPLPPAPLEMHLDRLLEGDGLLLTRWLRDR